MREIAKYFLLFGWLWDWQEFKYFDTSLKILAIVVNLIVAALVVALIAFLLTNPFSVNQVSPVVTVYVYKDSNTASATTVPTTTVAPTILPTVMVTPTATPVVLDGLFPETKIINGSSEGKKTVLIVVIPNKGQFTLPIFCGDNPAKVKSLMDYLTKHGQSIKDGTITFTLDIYQGTIISIVYRSQKPDGISEYDIWSCAEKISP